MSEVTYEKETTTISQACADSVGAVVATLEVVDISKSASIKVDGDGYTYEIEIKKVYRN